MKPSFLIKPLVLMMATLGVSSFANDNTPMVDLGSLEITGSHSSPYVRGSSSSATGLNLKLQETPQSVSVITKELLQDKKAETIADALTYSTAIAVDKANGRFNRITTRGFENDTYQVNGVSTHKHYSLSSDADSTNMYERIEITRGATGLLTGVGEPSASINLIRKQANSRELKGGGSLALGSWGHKKVVADGQSPLNADGSMRGRVAVSHLDTKTFRDWEHKKHSSIYATFDADVGDNTDVSLAVSYEKTHANAPVWADLPVFFSDGTRTDWARNKSSATKWNFIKTDVLKTFLDINHQFNNGWQWSNSAHYSTNKEDTLILGLEGTPNKETGLGMTAEPWIWQQKPKHFQFNSKLNIPFEAFNYPQEITIGATMAHTKGGWIGGNTELVNPDNAKQINKELGNFYTWNGEHTKPIYGKLPVFNGYTKNQSAIYAASRLQFAEPVKLILGGRFSYYKENNLGSRWGILPYVQKETALTPYLGVVYDVSKDHSVYASYTNIFKPQDNKDKNGKFLAPIKGNSYEVGVKNQWLDGQLNTNFALYQTMQDNFAQPDGKIGKTDQNAYKAIKGATVKGLEAEIVGQVTPDWDLMASFSTFKANKTPDGEELVSYAPRQSFKLFSKYNLSSYVDGLSVGGGVNWYGQPPITGENPKTKQQEKVGQPAYALVDLMAKYQINDKLSAQVNVNNALDKKYYYTNWGDTLNYGEPRNVKMAVSYQF